MRACLSSDRLSFVSGITAGEKNIRGNGFSVTAGGKKHLLGVFKRNLNFHHLGFPERVFFLSKGKSYICQFRV